MGHFSATDAVTRLCITAGDPVLLVHANPYVGPDWKPGKDVPNPYRDYQADTYHFGQELGQHMRRKAENAKMYGELLADLTKTWPELAGMDAEQMLDNLAESELPIEQSEMRSLHRFISTLSAPHLAYRGVIGNYNDYGWLELPDGTEYKSGLPTGRQISQPEYTDSAWDQRLPPTHMFFVKLRTLSELFLEGQPVTEENKLEVMYRLSGFAHATRIQLFGNTHSLLGRQDPDFCEFAEQRTLLRVIQNQLADLTQSRIKDGDHDERGFRTLWGDTPFKAVQYALESVLIRWTSELPGGDAEVVMDAINPQHVADILANVKGFRLIRPRPPEPSEHHQHLGEVVYEGTPVQIWLVKPEHALTKSRWDQE